MSRIEMWFSAHICEKGFTQLKTELESQYDVAAPEQCYPKHIDGKDFCPEKGKWCFHLTKYS